MADKLRGGSTVGGYTIWHKGNSGTNSGLDADLLDGLDGSYYQNATNLNAGTISDARLPAIISSDITGDAQTLGTKTLSTIETDRENSISISAPVGEIGQIAYLSVNSKRNKENGWLVTEGTFADTAVAVTAALANSVSNEDVFNNWGRFSHSTSGVQPASSTELTAWVYDATTDEISCTINSGTYIGFYSTTKYDDYLLDAQIVSTIADNDAFAIVIAFTVDENGVEHTISAVRRNDGALTWRIVYNYLGVGQYTVAEGSAEIARGGNWNTYVNGTRIKIRRQGDTITAISTENDSTTFDLASELIFSLTDDARLEKFRGPQPYGYACQSQQDTTFRDISFTAYGPNAYENYVFDLLIGDVYIPDGSGGYTLDATKTLLSEIGKGRIIRDKTSGKMWYISPTGNLELITSVMDVERNYFNKYDTMELFRSLLKLSISAGVTDADIDTTIDSLIVDIDNGDI